MKIKAFFLLTCFSFLVYSHNVKANVNQPGIKDHFSSIEFTALGMQNFLRNVYNSTEYAHDILPHSFDHLIQFLIHGTKTNQSRAYIRSVIKLFGNKAKELEYINPSAIDEMLEHMTARIKDYVKVPDINLFEKHKEAVNELLYQSFLTKFEQFKKEPNIFFDGLSKDILRVVDSHKTDDEISIEQLQHTVVRFLEVALNKLIWSPQDNEQTWESVKSIARRLETMLDNHIITDADDLDDLYWTLIHRYSYFLKIAGNQMPANVFDRIKEDMTNQELSLLSLEEQEEHMITKAQHLTHMIRQLEARRLAQEEGIVTA